MYTAYKGINRALQQGSILFRKELKAQFSYYLKKIAHAFLSSGFCCKNKVYALVLKSHFLNRANSHKKFPNKLICPCAIEIEFTNICNQDCVFCPNSKHNRERGVMPFDIFKKIVSQINALKVTQVIIGGFGEPFVDKELIKKLIYLRNNASVKVELVTNGILLTKKVCEAICKEKLLDSLDISIDSADAKTYNCLHKIKEFESIVSNLRCIMKIKKDFNFSLPFVCVRFKDFYLNKGSFRNFINVFVNLSDGIRPYMNIYKWPDSEMQVSSVDRRKLIKFPCPNLQEGVRINWNGDIVLCCMDYEGRVVLGNINDKSISDIWNSDKINGYREKHRKCQFDNLAICDDCDINSHLVIPW